MTDKEFLQWIYKEMFNERPPFYTRYDRERLMRIIKAMPDQPPQQENTAMKLKPDSKWKWIAKNEDSPAFLMTMEPEKYSSVWAVKGGPECIGIVEGILDTSFLDPLPWEQSLHRIHEDGTLEHIPTLKKGDRVLVRVNKDEVPRCRRYFSHFDESGGIHVFNGGTTEWSSDGSTSRWTHWKLPED